MAEWEKEQNTLKNQLKEVDDLEFDKNDMKNTLKLIGSFDISYSKTD